MLDIVGFCISVRWRNVSRTVIRVLRSELIFLFFFSSRRRHTRCSRDWSSDVCSSDLMALYRHVDDKNALLDGLVEVLLTEYPLPRSEGEWDERLTVLADGIRDTAQIGRASCRERV